MKFYILEETTEEKYIGIYPQVIYKNIFFKLSYANSNDLPFDKFPKKAPNFEVLKVHRNAIITDVMSFPIISRGWFISKRLKNLLQQFFISKHQYYPFSFKLNGKKYDYDFLYLISDLHDCIDFQKSKFIIYQHLFGKVQDIDIDSWDDYQRKKKAIFEENVMRKIDFEVVHFNQNFNPQLAIFVMPIGINIYISEPMKNLFESNGITGFEIKESDIIFEFGEN